jgi:hypothetical protein
MVEPNYRRPAVAVPPHPSNTSETSDIKTRDGAGYETVQGPVPGAGVSQPSLPEMPFVADDVAHGYA